MLECTYLDTSQDVTASQNKGLTLLALRSAAEAAFWQAREPSGALFLC